MELKSRAEVQLLSVLNQKKPRTASFYLEEQQKAQLEEDKPQSVNVSNHLSQFHSGNGHSKHSEEQQLITEVRQLKDDFFDIRADNNQVSAIDNEPTQIQLNAILRRERHTEAQSKYTTTIKEISEDIEIEILRAADRVKQALASFDQRLHEAKKSLENDELLLSCDNEAVLQMWSSMEAICTQRTQEIKRFSNELDQIETTRTQRVGVGLQLLTQTLMEIAYALPAEVERIIEEEAHEVNVVIISNRSVYADLIARMSTVDVDVFVEARLAWEQGQFRWRHLRHNHAIATFQTLLNSISFTNPQERQQILEQIQLYQQHIHKEKRLVALQQLENAGSNLTQKQAREIVNNLIEIQKEEEEKNRSFFENLKAMHDVKIQEMLMLREALRAELHEFGALAQEGDVAFAKDKLETLISDVALEEFFRMAGGLRSELDTVIKKLNIAELIYEPNVRSLANIVDIVLSAVPLSDVMEAQGKEAEWKAMQATLEKIRKAVKHEIVAQLPSLQAQLTTLSNVSDMSDMFKAEVEDIMIQVENIIEDLEPPTTATSSSSLSGAVTADDGSINSTLSSTMNTSHTRTTSQSLTSTRSTTGQSSESPGMSSTFVLSPTDKHTDAIHSSSRNNNIDLQAIRKVQRRLGILIYASELPKSIQQQLQFISDQLALQSHANSMVDNAIITECSDLLDTREQESRRFLEEMGMRMELQSAQLHGQSEKLARFYLAVVQCMEESAENVRYVDLSVMDLFDTLKDMNEETQAPLEAQFSQGCSRLRHSPNDATLQEEFENANNLLICIEKEYRAYHKRVSLAASNHVIAIDKQKCVFLRRLCNYFGLLPGQDADHDDQFDLNNFLSAKYIEDIVNPPPPDTGTQPGTDISLEQVVEGQQLDPKSPRATGTTPRIDASVAVNHGKSHPQTPIGSARNPIPAEPRETYRTESGLDMILIHTISELLHQILSPKSDELLDSSASEKIADESDKLGITKTDSADHDKSVVSLAAADEEDVATNAVVEKHQAIQKYIMEKAEAEFLKLKIPVDMMERMLTLFRDYIISKFDQDSKMTAQVTAQTRDQRIAEFDLLLEEQLRMHWPRKGRLDVQFYRPRMGELVKHRQRLERCMHSVTKRVEAQNTTFAKQVDEALNTIEAVRIKQLSCLVKLPMMTNLASLQGLEVKSKKLLSKLKIEGSEQVAALRSLSESDLNTFLSSTQDFVRACASQLFPDLTSCDVISGCDYHPDEIEHVKEKIASLESQVREQISQRADQITDIVERQNEILRSSNTFKTRYQESIQTLSMKDGLGQKYGLPRRTAQERYRSETNRCDERCAKLDELLASLQSVVDNSHQAKITSSTHTEGPDSLTTQIVATLLQLRAKIYNRGIYFGLLKNTSQLELVQIELKITEWNDVDGKEYQRTLRDRELVDDDDMTPPIPFLEFVKQVRQQCCDDTKALFQQEGKLDELPASGYPPALDEYLISLAEKANAYVLQQELKYREQVNLFGELLALAPEVAIMDLLKRSKHRIHHSESHVNSELEKEHSLSTAQKNQHMIELRPDLCSPNCAAILQELCDREISRSQELQAALRKFRIQLLESAMVCSFGFEQQLVTLFLCLMAILDSSVMTLEDLKPFSGEELPKLKRKSLKRLRKAARIQEYGDAREVKRTDKELAAIAQCGEVLRFPKRAWPAIQSFGVSVLWEEIKQTILERDGENTAVRNLDCQKQVSASSPDNGACISLLTHAHRCLVHVRDSCYADYVEFCRKQSQTILTTIQERLEDEVKWIQSWESGIIKMKEQ